MQKWQTISSDDVSHSKWFPISKNVVKLPSGKIIDDFYIANLPDVAIILPILKTGEIVLVSQYKYGADEVLLEVPGGFLQPGKTIEETAVAELEEEVGIKTTTSNLKSLGKVISLSTKVRMNIYGFLAIDLEFNSKQMPDENEEIEIQTITKAELKSLVQSNKINASETLALIFKATQQFPHLFD